MTMPTLETLACPTARRLQPVQRGNATINLLHFVTMLSEQQQEMPHVFGSGGEAVKRALQRGVNGRERQRLRRELRVGARSGAARNTAAR